MDKQAKQHTMRIYTSGTVDKDGKKIPDFTFKYTLSKVWEGCATAGLYRTACISAQQILRKQAEEVDEKTGERTHNDSALVTFANAITYASVDPDADFQRGKTLEEKVLALYTIGTVEEQADIRKVLVERYKAAKEQAA